MRRAHELGYRALAITDECSVAGLVRAHLAARDCGLHLICGSEFLLECGTRLVALVTDRTAWAELCTLITRGRRAAEKGSYRLAREEISDGLQRCMVLVCPESRQDLPASTLEWATQAFPGRVWLAVELLAGPDDMDRLEVLVQAAARHGLPLVAAGDVHMHVRSRRALQDLLTATRHRCALSDAGPHLFPSGERHLRPLARILHWYPEAMVMETMAIAARCSFSLDELRYEYPEEIVPSGHTPASWLRDLTETGIRRRWPQGVNRTVRAQIEEELLLIAELGYEPYFLTVYDIVSFARERGILCQGRGSAANSAVCYCLGITEVDPARINMLFGRFISRERAEPPDIDVDFEHERREEVIQYIYRRYGRDRAALAATVITYRSRSARRDIERALGREAPQTIVDTLKGFPRHLSQHVGGFVISRGPLHEMVPIENAAMADRTVIQWDKDDIDALGLLKVDVLALGMLSAIRKSLEMLGLDMQDIPADDLPTWRMIQRGDTMGVFQIESRAQMAMLPRLKPACFYDLVIEVAIVRPGPIQGDMVHPYLARRAAEEHIEYPSPDLEKVLARTLGVPIFQEQVMELAMVAAGFSAGEADQLRRAMAAWRRKGGLEPFEQKLKDGMQARGYKEEFADRVYRQICGFGEYGFPESHAASFALLVWVSCWLKCNHPAVFTAALLNSQPMGFYGASQLVQDLKRHGVEVRPVCVQRSGWDCVEEEGAMRLGLRMVKGLSERVGRRIALTRPFDSVEDLVLRAGLRRDEVERLAHADALTALSGHRHRAAWAVAGVEPERALAPAIADGPAIPLLPVPREADDILADYAHLGFTLRRHPLALLRGQLQRQRWVTAEGLWAMANGSHVSAVGLVINRQRPGTASGVTFMTLEDETGHINVIVWRQVAERFEEALLGARLLGVRGVVQREGDVLHLIARRLEDHSPLIGGLTVHSRDFH